MVKVNEPFIRDFLKRHSIEFREELSKDGKYKMLILKECPFDANHKGKDAAILIYSENNVVFKCFHESCKGKTIVDFVTRYEPTFLKDEKFSGKTSGLINEYKSQEHIDVKGMIHKVSDVPKKEAKWFIYPIIPKNNITTIAADGGSGKTTTWIHIVAATTRGELPAFMDTPTDAKSDIGNKKVLYLTSEDATEEVLKERFERAEANQEYIYFVSLENEHFKDIKFTSPLLEDLIREVKPTLCVFDPVQSFVIGKMGERNVMRQHLDCLTRLSQLYEVTFLIIAHTNKKQTLSARDKVSDSSDLWDKSRSVLLIGNTNEEGIKYLSHEKCNYHALCDTFLFSIDEAGIIIPKGTTKKRYEDFASESFKEKPSIVRDEAKDFIKSALSGGEIPVNELMDNGKALGFSKATLERAKKELKDQDCISYRKVASGPNMGVKWYIYLKGDFK